LCFVVQHGQVIPVLRARVSRCVDGMDLSLYEKSVRIRRAFLEGPGMNFTTYPSIKT
jgi:hypothetical protein